MCLATLFLLPVGQSNLSTIPQQRKLSAEDIAQLQSKAAAGDPEAELRLGRVYERGDGIAASSGKAYAWYRKAADQGNAEAEDRVGTMLRGGEGVEKDKAEAISWYRRAARQQYPLAMFNLATCFYNGDGLNVDDVSAYAWFLLAQEAGEPRANEALERMESEPPADRKITAYIKVAEMYKAGGEIPHNDQKAVLWYGKAADAGSPLADVELASMLLDGHGAAQSFPEALRRCEDAGEKKFSAGAFCAGAIYRDGLGVVQDQSEAARWFEKAAKLGHPQAMLNLGEMYWKGIGVTADNQTAYAWILLASTFSLPKAQDDLAQLKSEMTPKDVKKATQKATSLERALPPILTRRPS